MKTINFMPDELREKAAILLSERAVMNDTMKMLIGQMASHHLLITQMWADARKEIEKQGIKMAEDELVGFSFDDKTFTISRRQK
jgi:hypothetical protein